MGAPDIGTVRKKKTLAPKPQVNGIKKKTQTLNAGLCVPGSRLRFLCGLFLQVIISSILRSSERVCCPRLRGQSEQMRTRISLRAAHFQAPCSFLYLPIKATGLSLEIISINFS